MLRRIPAAPPAHVLTEVDQAAVRAAALWAADRELHFEISPAGGLVVQVRDRAGTVIGAVLPSAALEVLSGEPLGL